MLIATILDYEIAVSKLAKELREQQTLMDQTIVHIRTSSKRKASIHDFCTRLCWESKASNLQT